MPDTPVTTPAERAPLAPRAMPDSPTRDAADFVTQAVLARRQHGSDWFSSALVCADGFKVSVQASANYYALPRVTGADRYYQFECGFPSTAEPLLAEYAEDPNDLTGTVYGWVPAEVVAAVIEKHGGLV